MEERKSGPAVGVLVGGGEGAAEHKGARTHLLVVSDDQQAAQGGPATHACCSRDGGAGGDKLQGRSR